MSSILDQLSKPRKLHYKTHFTEEEKEQAVKEFEKKLATQEQIARFEKERKLAMDPGHR